MIKIHHDKKIFWWMIALIIVLIGVLVLIQYKEAKKKMSLECIQDSDCVKTQTTCCPCNTGGKEICKSKNAKTEPLNCPPEKDIICMQVYNCRQTACSCVNNKCT
jgi:hypothetical protein